jgi:hypothetical protein
MIDNSAGLASNDSGLHAPHRSVGPRDERERFLVRLFDTLWARYRSRMEYVRVYERLVLDHGAAFVNDHAAFRCFASQDPPVGTAAVSRLFEALGYVAAGCYEFPDKHLSSVHFRPPNPRLPKLFVSQLKTWELSPASRRLIARSLKGHRPPPDDRFLADLAGVERLAPPARERLLRKAAAFFSGLPWPVPQRKDVVALNEESQFGAWTLVNGYDVNHFTASVDSHGVPALDDIEKTVAALRAAGVPMKRDIEGAAGSKLRQSSTEAVTLPAAVMEGRRRAVLPWTYAYFELAERPPRLNPETGRLERFEGFLGGQASNLFEMTKTTR